MPATIRQRIIGERPLSGGKELEIEIREGEQAPVPALLQLPTSSASVGGVLMLHGLYSRKEVLSQTIGRALVLRSIATLSIDLPLHGARDDPSSVRSIGNPIQLVAHWRQALADARMAFGYLRARAEVDVGRTALVGYSMGSHIATAVAARDARVRALVVAAGGDLPEGLPFSAMIRAVADPLAAIRSLKGRPLLMIHGQHDRTMRPDQAQRLFDAAGEPKEIRWFAAGHRLPLEAADEVADWLKKQLG
jgi:uncharacterized protein